MFGSTLGHAPVMAIGLALAWLAGVRVYLTVLVVGWASLMGWIDLPAAFQAIASPWTIGACALLAIVEFLADKIPGADSGWDLLHTFVRVPAGAILAAALLSRDHRIGGQALLIGGAIALCAHAIKSATRALINTSPEPLSNWSASLAEDLLCLCALALLFWRPWYGFGLAVAGLLLIALTTAWSFRASLLRGRPSRTEAVA